MSDLWRRLEKIERSGENEAWERAGIVVELLRQGESTREIAAQARDRKLRSISAHVHVVRLNKWHQLLTAAQQIEVVPRGTTLPEGSTRVVTSAGLPVDAQLRALQAGLTANGLDKKLLVKAVRLERANLPELWDDDQRLRQQVVADGGTVLANQKTDIGLIAWAKATDTFQRIDRGSIWGNPFILDEDGDRDTVIELYASQYLIHKRGLLERLGTINGKVLGCWCYPEPCHGMAILNLAATQTVP